MILVDPNPNPNTVLLSLFLLSFYLSRMLKGKSPGECKDGVVYKLTIYIIAISNELGDAFIGSHFPSEQGARNQENQLTISGI